MVTYQKKLKSRFFYIQEAYTPYSRLLPIKRADILQIALEEKMQAE